MAEQVVILNPGESKVVSFTAVPSVAKTYQVAVDGLTGSFVASEIPVELASVYGVVTFRETGAPLSGVKVSIGGRTTYTNTSGEYSIENLAPGNYLMTLEKEGYDPLSDTVTLVAGNNKIDAEMTLTPALMASLHGYVTDSETGAAIAGAEIIVSEKTGLMEANVYTGTTDASGFYSMANMAFENSPIVVDISAEAAGYELRKETNIGLDEGDNVLNFEMTVPPPKFGSFHGLVVDSPTDAPLVGVLVTMNGLSTYTDTDGQYRFSDILAKSYTVTLSKTGYEPVEFEYNLTEGDHKYPTIKLGRTEAYTARLYGYITDNETGEPVVGADITVYQDYDTKTADYHVYTNEQGYYEITDMIPEVRASMVIYAGGYKDYTRTGIPIYEGDNERNIVLTWAGGSRDVPKFVSYSLPSQVVSGEEFPISMTVWLPYRPGIEVNCRLMIQPRPKAGLIRIYPIREQFLTAKDWDKCNEYFQGKYIRFDSEGGYTLETVARAEYEEYRTDKILPLPPGIYDVNYTITRQCVEVRGEGTVHHFPCDEEYDTGSIVVGTFEVLHDTGLASLTGVVTHVDTSERLQNVKVTISGPVSTSVHTNSEGEYEFLNLPVGDFTITLRDSRWYLTPGGWWDWGYVYATYNVSLKQGWNTKDMVV